MKRIFSIIIVVMIAFSVCLISYSDVHGTCQQFVGKSGNMSDNDLYDATNTFQYKGDNNTICSTYEHYNMNVSTGNTIRSGGPQITVLTHGLRGYASHWSNDGMGHFAYDSASIISRLESLLSKNGGSGAHVYWAKMQTSRSFNLYDLKDPQNKNNAGKYLEVNTTTEITDISKHIIIVFEATDDGREGYNYFAYEEFNYMLSKIVYDVKCENNNLLPRINLIGHSRGGLTNLEYALDHPFMIDSVFSLGTPYFGSDTASTDLGAEIAGECDGLNDIINRNIYLNYYGRWSSRYDDFYDEINYHAIGGFSDSDFVFDALIDDENYVHNYVSDETLLWLKGFVKLNPGFIRKIHVRSSALDFLLSLVRDLDYDETEVESYIEILTDIYYFPPDDDVTILENLWSSITHSIPLFGCPFFLNDLLVNLTSQIGIDEHSNTVGDYGFKTYQKCFKNRDYIHNQKKLSNSSMPAIVHNLEARDCDLINYVLSNINYGFSSMYIYEEMTYNTAKLVGYNGSPLSGNITLPSSIDNHYITEIGANFLQGNADDVTTIAIPSTVTCICDEAFTDLTALEAITFPYGNSVSIIGDEAFSGCENLSKFGNTAEYLIIPNTVTSIGDFAFYGTKFSYISIGTGLLSIGVGALSNIDCLLGISVDSNNDQYISSSYVLYDYNGYLIQYPSAKSQTSYSVPSQIGGNYVVGIADGAFIGADILTTINLCSTIQYIGNNAFERCSNLTSITLPSSLTVIGIEAFKNCEDLNAVSLNYGLLEIGVSAFEGCESLEEIEIPSSVTNIGSEAFRGCSSLEVVTINKCQAPLTTLGIRAFSDCASSIVIEVPDNRLGHYKNTTWWSSYRTSIVPKQNNIEAYYLNISTDLDLYDNISEGYNKLYKLVVGTRSYYDFQVSSSNALKIQLYNSSFVLIKSSSSGFTELLNDGSTYYLNIEYTDLTSSGTIHTSIERNDAHFHTYMYTWYNYTRHQKYCSCGDSTLEVHAVSAAGFGHQQYAICLICGGQASIGIVGPMGNNAYPYTENGSFILPNGVVVLVDQDVEAYMEGTLEFTYPGDIMSGVNIVPFISKKQNDFY